MKFVSLAKNPVPGGASVATFPGYDGSPIRYALWEATCSPRRGTICLFQGRCEYIEKYFETIADLRRRGFAVATLDWRGQGGSHRALSNKRKGHISCFSEFDRDLAIFMKTIVLPDCPPPFIALAHSMGGNILLRNASVPGTWFSRMILSAPMIVINEKMLGTSRTVARIYAELGCLIGMSTLYVSGGSDQAEDTMPFEGNTVTSDLERWTRNKAVVQAAPELGLGSPTIGWLRAALRSSAMISSPDYAARIQVPLLLFAAGNDEIVASRFIEKLGVQLKGGNQLLLMGAKHEILQETDTVRQRFWAAFDAYLDVKAATA